MECYHNYIIANKSLVPGITPVVRYSPSWRYTSNVGSSCATYQKPIYFSNIIFLVKVKIFLNCLVARQFFVLLLSVKNSFFCVLHALTNSFTFFPSYSLPIESALHRAPLYLFKSTLLVSLPRSFTNSSNRIWQVEQQYFSIITLSWRYHKRPLLDTRERIPPACFSLFG